MVKIHQYLMLYAYLCAYVKNTLGNIVYSSPYYPIPL